MNPTLFWRVALAAALSFTLAACGGGGNADGGTGGTGISFGAVTDFGSVIVNNSQIDDSAASISLDDNPGSGTHGGLKKGMVVKVAGTFSGNTGTATSITYRDNLEGQICSLTTTNGVTILRILGQTVIQNASTIVENGPLAVGQIVEVSGLPDDQERIVASFIERKVATTAIEVKGRIDTVATLPTKKFTINGLEVDYTTALIDNSVPGLQPAVGQFVEVKGTVHACGTPPGTPDTLTATLVELEVEGAGNIPNGEHAEVEGIVTTALSSGVFKIGEQEVEIAGSTRFLPEDFSQTDIVVGAKLEAEGTSVNGRIVASKIAFKANVKLESEVLSVAGASPTFTILLKGLPGITLETDSGTDFNGNAITQNTRLRFRGFEGANNTVLVTRVDSAGGGSNAFLQGPVDSAADPNISILGVPVNTSSPLFVFQNEAEVGIGRGAFFGQVKKGTIVKIKGNLSGTSIAWDEAELED